MTTNFRFLLAFALASGLTACSSKDHDKAPEQPTATTTTVTETTAAAPAASAPAAPGDTAKAATFDINTVPVTSAELGAFPYLSPLKGYSVNTTSSDEFAFERSYVFDGKNLVPVEGKVSQRFIEVDSDEKKASELMIQRNYETLIKGLGGVKVSSGEVPEAVINKIGSDEARKHGKWVIDAEATDTYVIRQKNKEVWVQMALLGSSDNYAINVTERAAMPQQATIMKADELKKN